jgi:ferric-dicitrate binding protein FerR (iron transport regulator)
MSHSFIKSIKEYTFWLEDHRRKGGATVSFQTLSQTLAPWPARSQASHRNGQRIQRAWAKLQALPPDQVQSPVQRRSLATLKRAVRFYGFGTIIKKRGYAIKWIPTGKRIPKGWRPPSVRIG